MRPRFSFTTFWLMIVCILLCSCAQSLKPFDYKYIPASKDIRIQAGSGNDEISILYVTCGMLLIEHQGKAIFFDPYFSYQKITSIPYGLKTRKRFYEAFKHRVESTIDKNAVVAGFVSHTHYDHLMDLPVLLHDKFFPNLKTVYGNAFIRPMMHHHLHHGVSINEITDKHLHNPLKPGSAEWIPIEQSMEVLPILSMHAPHKFGVLAMKGPVDEDYFRKEKFKNPYARSKGFKWDVGCSYSFMVRIKKADNTYFKIFVQTSASESKYGLPPPGEKADIALMCFASIPEVDNYPYYIVKQIQPQKLMLIHWEDFFRYPKPKKEVKIVRGTNKEKAELRIKALQALPTPPDIIMPRPGSIITVKY